MAFGARLMGIGVTATVGQVARAGAVAVETGVGMIGAQAGYTRSACEKHNTTIMLIAAGMGGGQGGLRSAAGVVFTQPAQGANVLPGGADIFLNGAGNAVQTGLTRAAHGEWDTPKTTDAVSTGRLVGFGTGTPDTAVRTVPTTWRPAARSTVNLARNARLDRVRTFLDCLQSRAHTV